MTKDERFEEILRGTQAQIRAYIAGLGVSLDYVDDVAQDVFVEFYKNMEKMPGDVEPCRWLKGIARNLSYKHFRRWKQASFHLRESIAELLGKVESRWERLQGEDRALLALHACLKEISEKNRQVIRLRYEEGLTSEAISKAMQVTPSAIRMTLLRVRDWLRTCVTQRVEGEGYA
ncbi:MAG: sigma-70 family RNA polymerase sigma factor [Kiritimatiellae bacterium]|nr:sigma-70 family RNA polymerase sigma factor [Kiritimatiellia bacterium]